MSIPEFKELLHKYNTGKCTAAEKALIEAWYTGFEAQALPELTDEQLAEILSLKPNVGKQPAKIRPLIRWIAAAAAVIVVIISVAIYHYSSRPSSNTVTKVRTDIMPGSNKAILTLSNGHTIALSGSAKGNIATQGNITINQINGSIEYDSVANAKSLSAFNNLSTPNGGQYHLVLADGTNVWLNSASSIKYPTAFTGNERRVEITGEAYFEVAHNKNMPFRVVSRGQTVEVLGTHFNINAYSDESTVKTTLLEGSVRVSSVLNGHEVNVLLKPGEQASLSPENIKVINADTDEAIAWKNGDFIFDNQALPDILRQIARWYDVKIIYQADVKRNVTYSGAVARSRNLSAVLKMLESAGNVRFKIDGNVVEVTN